MILNLSLSGSVVGACGSAESGRRACWCILAVVAAALTLFAPSSALAQTGHTFGVNFTKSCPVTARPGQTVTCTLRLENQDTQHSVSIDMLTDQAPSPGGPIVPVASCPTPFVLAPSNGVSGSGPDFRQCTVSFTIPANYAQATFRDQAEVMFHDMDIPILDDTNQASGTILIQYACCLPDGTCVPATQSECTTQGGVFQGLGTNCTTPQGCCMSNGTCVNVDPLCCGDLGGTVQTGSCTTPRGCCLSNGTCVNVDPVCCDELGGTVQVGLCTTPQGCCLSNGTCVNVDPLCCDELGGTVQTGSCTTPRGCCLSNGTCVNVDPVCCDERGGTVQVGLCTTPQGCCLSNGTCVNVDPVCCDERGGTVQVGLCTTPQGCCLSNGTCVNVDPVCCDERGGTPQTGLCTAQICCVPAVTCDIRCESVACDAIQLCAETNGAAPQYLWSTGETSRCITVSAAGTYSVTITAQGGCTCETSITASGSAGGGGGAFMFDDAITGNNQFKSGNKHYWFVDGVVNTGDEVDADNYCADCYERPTVQTYREKRANALVPPPYSDDVHLQQSYYAAGGSNPSYFEYLDIIKADIDVANPSAIVAGIVLFGDKKVGDNGSRTADFGESSHYNLRIADNPDGRGGLLLAAENPKDLNGTFKAKESMGYLDVDSGVSGPGGVPCPANDESDNLNGYELKVISDGKLTGTNLFPGSDQTVLEARRVNVMVNIDGVNALRPRVEFRFNLAAYNAAYPDYALDPSGDTICVVFEATRGLKGPSNYLWNDKYSCAEAGTPYQDNCGQPQNIYELDTLCACLGEMCLRCPNTIAARADQLVVETVEPAGGMCGVCGGGAGMALPIVALGYLMMRGRRARRPARRR